MKDEWGKCMDQGDNKAEEGVRVTASVTESDRLIYDNSLNSVSCAIIFSVNKIFCNLRNLNCG